MDAKLESQLKSCTTLPSIPAVALRFIEAANDPDICVADVAKLVKMDPAIVSKVLQVTNSPLYGLRRKVDNLRQAIALLGINACLTLALNFSLASSLCREKGNGIDHEQYWRRSLIAAMACQVLGERNELTNLEPLFLSGLLQDIGILALDKQFPGEYAGIYAKAANHMELHELEQQAMGAGHVEVGAWLLEQWSLPELILSSVQYSHTLQPQPLTWEEDCFHRCVALSGWLADIWLTDDREAALVDVANKAKELLFMDDEALTYVITRVSNALPEMSDMFEIELSGPDQIEAILEQAREVLMMRNLRMLQQLSEEQKKAMAHVQELEEKTSHDGLTGLYNREYLDKALDREFTNASEHGWPLSLVFVDLDNFKDVNDTFGHQFGDEVLISTARFFMQALRQCDTAARYGGEEIVLVLPGLGAVKAKKVLDRLIKSFSEIVYTTAAEQKVQVTFSAGLATHMEKQHFDSVEDMIRAADRSVYAAKRAGRNRIEVYGT